MNDYLRVGFIATTHGIRGEVKVFPTTDDVKRFETMKEVFLDTGKELLPLQIEQARCQKQMVLLKFKGMDSIEAVDRYRGRDLLIPRAQGIPLQEGEAYIGDILNAAVYTEDGARLGTVTEVMRSPANDILAVKTADGKEILIPVIRDCILAMWGQESGEFCVKVHLLPGMTDEPEGKA